jgi:hypothetical protein
VKQRLAVMLDFKRFRNAATTIAGIELTHRIRKGQFALGTRSSRRSCARCLGRGTRKLTTSRCGRNPPEHIDYLHQSHSGHLVTSTMCCQMRSHVALITS